MSNPASSDRALRRALARAAYHERRIRIAEADWSGLDCLVASRQGLFGVARERVTLLLWGQFFGTAAHGAQIYVFEACDRTDSRSKMGRIVRLTLHTAKLTDARVLIEGLDNQCHQIAVIDGLLHVVDTAGQCIRRFDLDGSPAGVLHPLGAADEGPYRHINSIAQVSGQTLLVLHNGVGAAARSSQRAVLDDQGGVAEMHDIAGHGCHDIWADDGGHIWHCGSMAGELVRADGRRVKVSEQMTRGVARHGPHLLVGTSLFGPRGARNALGGSLLTLDEEYRPIAQVPLPGAPTTILVLPCA